MTAKISFQNDYSEIGHPRMLEALKNIALEQNTTYGQDQYSEKAAGLIRDQIGRDCDIHFIAGGTQANIVNISTMLKPYESIIACDSSHIALHETGAIEATGHKINTVPNKNGKITIEGIAHVLEEHHFEHMVLPRAVFISQATELGTLYSKQELSELSRFCKEKGLYLYLDGARLGSALTSKDADFTLTDIAGLVDMFYMGGTKNGALIGEAIVIMNDHLKPNFRYALKQRGFLAAKGMVIGAQFLEFFKDGLYIKLAKHANAMAEKLVQVLSEKGFSFQYTPQTNQIFPKIPVKIAQKLEERFSFYRWETHEDSMVTIRLVTSWATKEEDVEAFENML